MGSAFQQYILDEIIKWTKHCASPAFVISTKWETMDIDPETHFSILLQYEFPKTKEPYFKRARYFDNDDLERESKPRWKLSSIPIVAKMLPGVVVGGRRFKHMDINNVKNECFYFEHDEDVIEMLRTAFEIDLWSIGMIKEQFDFQASPKLLIVDKDGYFTKMRLNNELNAAYTLRDWEEMVRCFLKIIRLFSLGRQ